MFTEYYLDSSHQVLAEQGTLSFAGLEQAYKNQDPRLAEYICLSVQLNPAPREMFRAIAQHLPTLATIQQSICQYVALQKKVFQPKTRREQKQNIWKGHDKAWQEVLRDDAQKTLPELALLPNLLMDLWNDTSKYAREQLLQVLASISFAYGPWKAIKRIFKEAEQKQDWQVFTILAVRFSTLPYRLQKHKFNYIEVTDADQALIQKEQELRSQKDPESVGDIYLEDYGDVPDVFDWEDCWDINDSNSVDVSQKTIDYLRRRVARVFRSLAKDFPQAYPAIALDALLMMQEMGQDEYNLFRAELFQKDYTMLLRTIELLPNYAGEAFALAQKYWLEDFRNISVNWLSKIAQSTNASTQKLVFRWFKEVSAYESGTYAQHGLHKIILGFLGFDGRAWSNEAQEYALQYLRTEGIKESSSVLSTELNIDKMLWLLRHSDKRYSQLAEFLLFGAGEVKDSPFKQLLTLEVWTDLLEDVNTFHFAENAFRMQMTSTDLAASWYGERLLSTHAKVRMLAMNLLRDDTKYNSKQDWTSVYMGILHNLHAEPEIYQYAIRCLSAENASQQTLWTDRDGNGNFKITVDFLRMLLLHPFSIVREKALQLIDKLYTHNDIGVEFWKVLSSSRDVDQQHKNGWESFLGKYYEARWMQHLQENAQTFCVPEVSKKAQLLLQNEYTVQEIGTTWLQERVERWDTEYDFIRKIYTNKMPFAEIYALVDMFPLRKYTASNGKQYLSVKFGEDALQNGIILVSQYIFEQHDANSKRANFYKQLLLVRHRLYRKDNKIFPVEFSAENSNLAFVSTAFDFAWFTKWSDSKRAPIRQFAMQMAKYEIHNWTRTGVDFVHLQPLLEKFQDIRDCVFQSIFAPTTMDNKIDIDTGDFTPKSLYDYCFTNNAYLRLFAFDIIQAFPVKYGDPKYLLQLSDSKDPRVRQMVIQVLWRLFGVTDVTSNWKPFSYSVVPFDLSAKIDPIRETGVDPNTLGIEAKDVPDSKKYLGLGTPLASHTVITTQTEDQLKRFFQAMMYSVSGKPTAVAVPGKSVADDVGVLHAGWKNKKTLVEAMTDVAKENVNFKNFIIPVLREFESFQGKTIRNACLVALAKLENDVA